MNINTVLDKGKSLPKLVMRVSINVRIATVTRIMRINIPSFFFLAFSFVGCFGAFYFGLFVICFNKVLIERRLFECPHNRIKSS